MAIGEAPACISCAHLQLKKAKMPGESVRAVDGSLMVFICGRSRDALTGNPGELCSTERAWGLCGPRGLFYEEAELPELAAALAEDDDPVEFGEFGAPPAVVEEGEEFEDD